MKPKSGLLLSGGMDSIAVAFQQRPCLAITINYGQLAAEAETRAASAVAAALGIEHHIIEIDLRLLGSGQMAGCKQLPIAPVPEWWPFRNQMLVTLGAMDAIRCDVSRLLIGTVKSDSSHLDGTPQFVKQLSGLLALQEGSMDVVAPAIDLTSGALIRQSGVPFEILAWAHSCHVSNYACGLCRGCYKHYQTLEELGHEPY